MWYNFVLTQMKKLLYKLNDWVNAGADPRVPRRLAYPKIELINF